MLTNIPSPYRIALFERLARVEDVDLHVAFNALTEANRFWSSRQEEWNFKHTLLPGRSIKVAGKGFLAVHLNQGVKNWIDDNEFDVVILAGWNQPSQFTALWHCRSKKIPVVFWSGSIGGNKTSLRRFSRLAMRYFVRRANAYIAYGSDSADYLEGLGASRTRIMKAFNTVDIDSWRARTSQVSRQDARNALRLGNEVVFLFVGQLVERKGIRELLEAVCTMRAGQEDVKLLVAGTGPLEEELRESIARSEHGSRVSMLGHIHEKDLAELYVSADVVVLPSNYEVWGLVLNEAMATGRPVITTSSVGAARDLVSHGRNGWLVPAGDVERLRAQLEECVSLGAQSLQVVGQEAMTTVFERFNLDVAVAAMNEAIQLAAAEA